MKNIKNSKLKTSFLSLASLVVLCNCAQTGKITGGDKDASPPVIDSTKTIKSGQTNFTPTKLQFYFNEWIELKDGGQNIFILPPVNKRPIASIKNKTVVLDFQSIEWKPNTTYQILSETSIVDITENNPHKLNFVFSTGSIIDTCTINGTVTDWFSKMPMDKISVLLYKTNDSISLIKNEPNYFGLTDKTGKFMIKHMAAGHYFGLCVEDKNFNLKLDTLVEKAGIIKPFYVSAYSIQSLTNLWVAEPIIRLDRPIVNNPNSYLTKIDLPYLLKIEKLLLDKDSQATITKQKNSIQVEHFSDSILSRKLFINYTNQKRIDTISITSRSSIEKAPKVIKFSEKNTYAYGTKILLTSDVLIKKINLDTIQITPWHSKSTVEFDSINNEIILTANYPVDSIGSILIPSGLVEFKNGNLSDSSTLKLRFKPLENFATLEIKANNFNKSDRPIFYLLQDGKKIIHEWANLDLDALGSMVSKPLEGTNYEIVVFLDQNDNGIWDGFDVGNNILPEKIYRKKLENLKSNWNLTVDIDRTVIFED